MERERGDFMSYFSTNKEEEIGFGRQKINTGILNVTQSNHLPIGTYRWFREEENLK